MLRYKFIITKPKGAKRYVWYEFMIEGDKLIKGEIYKWRKIEDERGGGPSSLELYITSKLPILFKTI